MNCTRPRRYTHYFSHHLRIMAGVLLLCLTCSCLPSSLYAQGWFRTYDEFIEGHSIVRLADGGYVISGRSGIPGNSPIDDASLLRIDIDGQVVWANTYGGSTQRELAIALIQDRNGDLVATGSTNSFSSSADALLFKTDLAGNQRWILAYGDPFESDRANTLLQTADGGYLLTGCFDCTGTPQAFLLKTDADGAEQWSQTYTSSEEGFTLLQTPDGGYLLGGVTDNESEDFVSGAVLIKTDANGNTQWEQIYEGDYYYNITSILPQSDGYFLAGAASTDTAMIQPDIYLLKTNLNGDSLWTRTYGSDPEGDICFDLKQRQDGSLLLAGTTFNSGEGDYYIINTDTDGNVLWEYTYGSELEETAKSLVEAPDGRLGIAGVSRARDMGGNVTTTKVLMMRLERDGRMGESYIYGQVFMDNTLDCQQGPGEMGFPELIVEAVGSRTYYGTTDAEGRYRIPVNGGFYDVRVYTPDYWDLCPAVSLMANPQGTLDSVEVNFGLQQQAGCPQLEVDLSTPLLRRGMLSTYTVNYCNNGPVATGPINIEIEFDDDFNYFNSSLTPVVLAPNRLRFSPPELAAAACGSFELNLVLNSSGTVDGETHCVSAQISPDSICLPVNPSWEGYTIEVDGVCQGDSTLLYIRNTSDVNMTQSRQFIVIEDMIIERTNSFRLNGNEEMILVAHPEGKTLRFEVDQAPGHPGSSLPSLDIEGCGVNGMGDFSRGLATVYPEDDGNIFVSHDCQESVSSFLAEEQKGYPKGRLAQHFIEANTDIEYHIRWQNTSGDTVDRIVIRDTLSPFVRPESLQAGSSSHSYAFELHDNGVARFTFENIKLPPASTNEAGSQAYVKFRIAQQPNNPAGTLIENRTAVYFDDLQPTDAPLLFHTIERGVVYATQQQDICEGDTYANVHILADTTVFDTTALITYDSITIAELEVLQVPRLIEEASICNGEVYFFNNLPYNMTGFYTDSLSAANGCDSLSSLALTVQASYSTMIDSAICEGESVLFGGLSYNITGLYANPLSAANGCDSLELLNLLVLDHTTGSLDTTILLGESYNGIFYENDTVLIDTLINTAGCDSILTTNIFVQTVSVHTISEFAQSPKIQPNPTRAVSILSFELHQATALRVDLYDPLGRQVLRVLDNEELAAGAHRLRMDLGALPQGTYWLRFQTDRGRMGRRVIVLK
ncbi:MAG: T9SS type A sorting domain-containing protein [Bacteroidota bacterium]